MKRTSAPLLAMRPAARSEKKAKSCGIPDLCSYPQPRRQDAKARSGNMFSLAPAPAKSGLSAISLCSGTGGMDLGLESSGWDILCQVEMDDDCASSLKARRHASGRVGNSVLHSRLEDIAPRRLRESLGLKRQELGLLAGGPPCQPFTTHGRRRGITDARAVSLFPKYLEYVAEFLPQSILIENVDGMLSAALRHRPLIERGKGYPPLAVDETKGSFLKWLLGELASLGYCTSWGVAEAADYGVPQFRQRAIIIGVRGKMPCYLPQPLYWADRMRRFRTLRDALATVTDPGPVQPLSASKRRVYELVPEGGNWRDLPREVQERTMGAAFRATGGKSGWWRRLSWDAPSPTILGMPDHSSTGLIHPNELRCLGLYECAAIQTFPANTYFAGSPRSQYQQVGDAVPPLLGEALGNQIISFLAGNRLAEPEEPAWRQSSANRRIGTHGWVVPGKTEHEFVFRARIREDHVWSDAA